MYQSWIEVLQVAACGGVGGAIFWAAREHGGVFVQLWNRIARRQETR